MSIKKGFNPNAGDRTYRIILKRSLTPNNNNQTDYSDSGHDYSDDAPDYSNYQDYSPDQEDNSYSNDGVDQSDNIDDDDSSEDNNESKENRNKSKKNNKDSSRNKLRDAEHDYGRSNSNRRAGSSSLAKRERGSGSNFKYSGSKSGRKHSGGFKGFMSQHKSGVLTGLSGTFVFGGMMSGSMLLSGPAQFLQIMHFIRNTYNTVRELQSTLREAKNMKTILRHRNLNLDDRALLGKYGEVGLLSKRSSVRYAEALNKNGIITKLTKNDIKMYIDHKQLEIDWKCHGENCVGQQVVNKLGGKVEDYKVNPDRKSIEIDLDEVRNGNGIFKKHNLRKFFSTLGRKSGMHFWSRWSGQRAFARAANIVYGFHPFAKARQLAQDSIEKLILRALKTKTGKKLTGLAEKANQKASEVALKLYNKTRILFKNIFAKGFNLDLSKFKSQKLKEVQDNVNKAADGATEDIANQKVGSGVRSKVNPVKNFIKNGVGIVGILAALFCTAIQMEKQVEKIRWVNNILPAIQLSIEVIATAGQMMAGRMSMAQLSVMSRKQFYDDNIPDPDHPGKFTSSSWWDSAPVNAELGLDVNASKDAKVPSEVRKASNGSFLSLILGTVVGGWRKTADNICGALEMPIINLAIDVLDIALDIATGGATFAAAMSAWLIGQGISTFIAGPMLGWALQQGVSWLTGVPLDITNQLPAQFGDITAYGSKFNQSQNGLHDSGGAVLSAKAAAEVNRQKNVWLAEEWNDKPLLAKLFDPTDYRSGLGTLARNARLNPNPETILASITNTFKLLAAVPSTAVSLAINSPAQTALAASGAPKYNYDVDEVAIPPSTLDSFTSDDDDGKDELSNAEQVMNIFHSEEAEKKQLREQGKSDNGAEFNAWKNNKKNYTDLANACLAKDINDDGMVSDDDSINSENGGFTFMYLSGNSSNRDYKNYNCANKLDKDSPDYDETLARIAMYVGPDVSRARATECLANPDDSYSKQACVGAGLDYGDSSNTNKPANGGPGSGPNTGSLSDSDIAALNPSGSKIVEEALKQVGKPYVYGAAGPNTFDCSGLTQWAYKYGAGINICHNDLCQKNGGKAIPVSEAQPGDILWKPGHVAIYIGNGKYVHAPQPGENVKVTTFQEWNPWVWAVRYTK